MIKKKERKNQPGHDCVDVVILCILCLHVAPQCQLCSFQQPQRTKINSKLWQLRLKEQSWTLAAKKKSCCVWHVRHLPISPVSILTIYTVFCPPGSLHTWCPLTTVCTPPASPTQPSSRPTSSRSPPTATSAPSTAREYIADHRRRRRRQPPTTWQPSASFFS